ncbi:MAG: hypothetical protein HY000_39440 [Planctomycetes bacterium]|nr:hypothetical protein [Planctomycetota bacterium]
MARSQAKGRLRFPFLAIPLAGMVGGWLLTAAPVSQAGSSQPILRVEEDWVLVLNEPKSNINSPQFHTVMSPFDHLSSYYGQVTWNYWELPSFTAGGLQMQIWNGDNCVRRTAPESRVLSTAAETITWTQVLETDGADLSFSIENGSSSTWGTFLGFRAYTNANVANLSGYSTSVSVDNSLISYGSNRVVSLVITEVRKYDATGLVSVDQVDKVVFQLSN